MTKKAFIFSVDSFAKKIQNISIFSIFLFVEAKAETQHHYAGYGADSGIRIPHKNESYLHALEADSRISIEQLNCLVFTAQRNRPKRK